ncbi:uncharacterized protein HaLaN_01268 [Haematococcus lacustris]|uniref:Sfi1 spindle body domain-containing protein n=1 Tax=Haematococcus lacustris TaxID=44745 RepID=A0A699YFI4_HAELA|nr:uncharacterized protein HaLaN_01268 [Haematococcus lacustris]
MLITHAKLVFCLQSVLHRLLHRTLSCAFNGWLSHAQQSRRLGLSAAAVVARLRNQALYAAWRSWQELVQEQREVAEKIATALGHWGNGRLARAFNQWLDYWQHRTLETVADVHYFGRLLDTAWLAWHRVASDSVATRGVEANKMLTSRRALDCWRQFAQEAQRHKALPDMLAALVTVRTLQDWRMLTKANIQRQAAQHAAALQHRKLLSLVGVWLEAARASALAAAKADAHWRR